MKIQFDRKNISCAIKTCFALTKAFGKKIQIQNRFPDGSFVCVWVRACTSRKNMCVIFQTEFSSFSKLTSVKRMTESCFSLVAHSTTFPYGNLIFLPKLSGNLKFNFPRAKLINNVRLTASRNFHGETIKIIKCFHSFLCGKSVEGSILKNVFLIPPLVSRPRPIKLRDEHKILKAIKQHWRQEKRFCLIFVWKKRLMTSVTEGDKYTFSSDKQSGETDIPKALKEKSGKLEQEENYSIALCHLPFFSSQVVGKFRVAVHLRWC